MAFTAKQVERIAAVGDNWDELWDTMASWQLKPIAPKAVQGHNQRVDEDTPHDDRFDEEDARGDLRTAKLKHSYDGWKVPFVIHATRKGINSITLKSILKNGLYNGGLTGKKKNA